jgi:small subunit ribosomal protein S6
MALYETVFITRQDLTSEDVDALSAKFMKIITDMKGKVEKEYWGLRNLAFTIKKNNRGHYVLLKINSDYPAVAELNRVMSFNEDVIRNTTYSVKKHSQESSLFVASSAKDSKNVKTTKKEPSKLDLTIDQLQFDA